jgi:hypothetical protein
VSEWRSQVMRPDHQCGEFSCGQASPDDWLRAQTLRAQISGTARTHVWTSPADDVVTAYFAIAPP